MDGVASCSRMRTHVHAIPYLYTAQREKPNVWSICMADELTKRFYFHWICGKYYVFLHIIKTK